MEEYIKELMLQYQPIEQDHKECKDFYDNPKKINTYNAGFRRGATQVLNQIWNKFYSKESVCDG